MSKYSKHPLDFAGLKTVPLRERGARSRLRTSLPCIGRVPGSRGGWIRCPGYWREFVSRGGGGVPRRARGSAPYLGTGRPRHQVRVGAGRHRPDAPRLRDRVALNGAAAIHDFEIALAGHTSEDVEAVLPDGRFGAAEETGGEMNRAIAAGDREGAGMGEALGRWLDSGGAGVRGIQPAAAATAKARR